MIDIKDIQQVYFIGIGGIGMSALARYFKFHGKEVSGYDKTETNLTKELIKEGIAVHYEDNPTLVPKNTQLVVYTPAVPKDHRELEFFRQEKYPVYKRSEVLGAITQSSFNICVAGTHGKTTITTMIAHILRHSGYGCNAFLGGIAVNYNSNFWSDQRDVCVIEADEYDRSFLRLNPDIAVISAMDADHLDIYGTVQHMQEAFVEFSGKIKTGGLLLSRFGLPLQGNSKAQQQLTYSLQNEKADVVATKVQIKEGSYHFDIQLKDRKLENVLLNMGGLHNVENITAAMAVALRLGIEEGKIKAAVEAFRGVKRRFEYIIKNEKLVFIDDYAHHPEELRPLISGAKGLFPGRKCTIIFQPHLYSRTRDFADGFAEVLDMADEVVLLPIYPARELPIEGVTSEMILKKMKLKHKKVLNKEETLNWLREIPAPPLPEGAGGRLLITAGAGDIDALVQPIKKIIESK